MEGEFDGVYRVPFGAAEWAFRVRAMGLNVLSSNSRVIAIAEGGADVVGWRDWLGCLDLPREFDLEILAKASSLWMSGACEENASASEPLRSRTWAVL